MSTSGDGATLPKSMRHKQILDVAAENPDATVEAIAREVPSATPDLVERVLDEYGDPAAEDDGDSGAVDSDTGDDGGSSSASDAETTDGESNSPESDPLVSGDASSGTEAGDVTESPSDEASDPESEGATQSSGGYPTADDLSEKQLQTLRTIAEHPESTQRDLADRLGVTAATVSRRMNTIDGFEWADREAFANAVLPNPEGASADGGTGTAGTEGGPGAVTTDSEDDSSTDGEGQPEPVDTEGSGADDQPAEPTEGDCGPSGKGELASSVEDLADRVAALESELQAGDDGADGGSGPVFDDPELMHKVVQACVDSSEISPAEETQILETLFTRGR